MGQDAAGISVFSYVICCENYARYRRRDINTDDADELPTNIMAKVMVPTPFPVIEKTDGRWWAKPALPKHDADCVLAGREYRGVH